MCGEVVFAEIGFDFDNFSDALNAAGMMDKPFSKQFVRDENCVAVIKSAWQFLHGGRLAQFPV